MSETLADEIFASSAFVRYVAVREGDNIFLHERDQLSDASSPESDRYEEMLVNPPALLLFEQRGKIDCGGLEYVLVGYGNFTQLLLPTPAGHVSVALERDAVAIDAVDTIRALITTAST